MNKQGYRIKAAIALLEKVTRGKVKLVENAGQELDQNQKFISIAKMLTAGRQGNFDIAADIKASWGNEWKFEIIPYEKGFDADNDSFTIEGTYEWWMEDFHRPGTESDSDLFPVFEFSLTKVTDNTTGAEMDQSIVAKINDTKAFKHWMSETFSEDVEKQS